MPKATNSDATKSTKASDKRLRAFASSVGDFIRYWGFRRIHGQIWALLYLSQRPLSGAELTRALGVSKSLVSPALTELLSHKLIFHAGGDLKTKIYRANPDVNSVVADVLTTRESNLLKNAHKKFVELRNAKQMGAIHLDDSRLAEVDSMISTAQGGLEILLQIINQTTINPSKDLLES